MTNNAALLDQVDESITWEILSKIKTMTDHEAANLLLMVIHDVYWRGDHDGEYGDGKLANAFRAAAERIW